MVHTLPDHTTKYRMTTVFANIDDAELAARLGSIVNFDRSGNVFWLDDFEAATLKWDISANANSGTTTLSALYPYLKSQCVELSTIAQTNSVAYMSRTVHYPLNTNIGFQFNFTTPTNDGLLYFYVKVYIGAVAYEFGLLYDEANSKLYSYSVGGEYDDLVDTITLKVDPYTYNTIKLVLDLTAFSYKRLLLNNHAYPLTTSYGPSGADSADPYIFIRLQLSGSLTGISKCYIDNFVLTQNEL